MLPNPLDKKYPSIRILSDRGIRQALDYGMIKVHPSLENDAKRIQPATLDVKLCNIDEAWGLPDESGNAKRWGENQTFYARNMMTANLTEAVDIGQLSKTGFHEFFGLSTEARSSLRRLGCYISNPGFFFTTADNQSQVEIGNFSHNDIHFEKGDRIAQIFFHARPFQDYGILSFGTDEEQKEARKKGEMIRSLDMGIEVRSNRQLRELQSKGFFEIFPKLELRRGSICVHASRTAYRMKKIEGGIIFKDRDKYSPDVLLEPIDISKGYAIRQFEHIIIETEEQLKLSPHIGIRFWDNLRFITEGMKSYRHLRDVEESAQNIEFSSLTDGWVDPGYVGGFSRQPKWLGKRIVHPGDVVGFGQVFFFPNGVGKAYGDASLGSQYLGKGKTEFRK